MNTQINDKIISLINKTPDSVIQDISRRVKERRLEKNLTQKSFAARAGIALPTYRKFESSGEISFRGLVLIALALDRMEELDQLFATPAYKSIDEIVNLEKIKKRKRARNE